MTHCRLMLGCKPRRLSLKFKLLPVWPSRAEKQYLAIWPGNPDSDSADSDTRAVTSSILVYTSISYGNMLIYDAI